LSAMESGSVTEIKEPKLLQIPFPDRPGAIKVLQPVEEDHTFLINIDALEKILCDKTIAGKNVCVIGVAGKFRKGKSFLLNFFLRYLNYVADGSPQDEDWLEREKTLTGFSWRGGSERDTDGIIFWSKPIVVKDKNGEDLVILLMDTQGSFDQQSTVKDCATVFALSTMISSLQVYNLQNNIHEDDLANLQFFAEYGRLVREDESNLKPFQSLVFLVRDWGSPFEIEYGFDGGRRLLDLRLNVTDNQHDDIKRTRADIRRSFEKLECFLMPHPGYDVAENRPGFNGNLSEIRDEFKSQLRVLVPRIVDPKNVEPKEINGKPVTCQELFIYFTNYAKVFSGESLPEPRSLLSTTIEANNLSAIAIAQQVYVTKMQEVCGGEMPFISTAELEKEHHEARNESVRCFKKTKKMGGSEYSLEFLEKLDVEITKAYEEFVKSNSSKNLFKSMRTPAVLVTFLITNYFFQEVFQLFGLDGIATIFSLILTLSIIALATWTYSRYSGNIRDIAGGIDGSVTWLWENYFSPTWGQSMAIANKIK
jgi:atlastin